MKVIYRKEGQTQGEFTFEPHFSAKQERQHGALKATLEVVKPVDLLDQRNRLRLRLYKDGILIHSYTVFGYMDSFEIDE